MPDPAAPNATPPASQTVTPEAPKPPVAQAGGEDWKARFEASEAARVAADAARTKDLADLKAKLDETAKLASDPVNALKLVAAQLGLAKEKDPAVAFQEEREARAKADKIARTAVLQAEVTDAMRQENLNPTKSAKQVARLLDLDDVTLDASGKVDSTVIRTRVAALRTEYPELFVSASVTQAAPAPGVKAPPATNTPNHAAPPPPGGAQAAFAALTPEEVSKMAMPKLREMRAAAEKERQGQTTH